MELREINHNTIKDVKNEAIKKAIKKLKISALDLLFVDKPQDLPEVKIEVGKIMENKIVGRPDILRTPKTNPSREAHRLIPKAIDKVFHTYPKYCIKDSQKYTHLRKLYQAGGVAQNIYIELVEALNVPKYLLKTDPVLSTPDTLLNLFG